VLLADLVATSRAVAATTSRNAKTALIAELLSRARDESSSAHDPTSADDPASAHDPAGTHDPAGAHDVAATDEVGLVVRYLSGTLRQRRTGIQLTGSTVVPEPALSPSVTVVALDACLQDAAGLAGSGSSARRARLFHDLLAVLTPAERDFVYGLLRGGIRQGALESVVLAAAAQASGLELEAVRRAVTVSGSLADVASAALCGGAAALDRFALTVGQGVSPMLASSAKSVAEALARTGPAAVEWKLDGIRAQIHRDGPMVRVLTRSLDDITARVPEVVEAVLALPVQTAIFDGELIALYEDGRPRPFQETGSRTATRSSGSTALSTFLFDVLHLDGRDLIDEPSPVRRQALAAVVPAELLTPALVVLDPTWPEAVAEATAFAESVVARGHEGVVVKADSALYEMGRRGAGWVKVKPVHTLDLVILAVERGNGRRSQWLSNLHLGARDPSGRFGPSGGFVMLGKTFKGLTDEMLRWQTEVLPRLASGPADEYVVTLRPEVVVEIAFDGVQTSPRYPAGLALRFARVIRHRPDKSAQETDVIEDVEALRAAPPSD
jgi:DNA ligase-1